MVDIESTQPPQGIGGPSPTNTPIVQLQRLAYLLIAGGLLHKPFNAYRVVLLSPHVSHEWFKLGLAGTIALLFVKAHLELYEGRVRKQRVNYAHYPQTTQFFLLLWLLTSICYFIALHPHYGIFNSLAVLGLTGFALLQLALMVPNVLVQNGVSLVALIFFLQMYN